jgi:hypothetical protein
LVDAAPDELLLDAAPDLFTPPWWLQAPLPAFAEVVPSLHSTGAEASVVDVAVSAALLNSGKANTLANKALYINALEIRIFMEGSPVAQP